LLSNDDLKAMSDRIDRHRAEQEQQKADAVTSQSENPQPANDVPKAASESGTVGQITVKQPAPAAQPKDRQTPDGKPVPPPPVDEFAQQAAPTFAEDAEDAGTGPGASSHRGSKRSASVPVLFNPIGSPALEGVSDVRAAAGASPWIFVKGRREGGGGGDTWERFDASQAPGDWKPSGSAVLDQLGQMIFSPSGEFVVRQKNAALATIEAWSFNTGQLVQTIEGRGTSDLVGFVDEDRFIVFGGFPDARLTVVSIKTGKKVLELVPPSGFSFHGRECSISPDGALLAAPATGETPALLLYNTSGGVNKRVVLPGFAGERFRGSVTPEASVFSHDGKKLAVVVRHYRSSLLFVIAIAEGKVLASFEYPDFTFALRSSPGLSGEGRFIQWLADTDCVVLKDYVVVDTDTGRVVGCIDLDDVRLTQNVGGGKLLVWRGGGGGTHLDVGTVDAEQLKARLEAAKAAGPMQFDPPDISGPMKFAATVTAPRTTTSSSTVGAPPDPAGAPEVKAVQTPIAIDASYSRIREVLFSRPPAAPAAVVALALPGASRREWDPLRDPDFVLQRVDLASGAVGGAAVHLPIFSRLLAISPDATLAVVASDVGDRMIRHSTARLDVVSLMTGKTTAAFAPYADLNAAAAAAAAAKPPEGNPAEKPKVAPGPYSVIWAGMTENNDGLLTLSGSHVLVRWSLSGHKAMWARTNVLAAPVFSPRGKYLAAFENNNGLLLIDPNSGDPVGSLAAEPLVGNELKGARFSSDGSVLYGMTANGLFRWDVKSGQAGNPITTEAIGDVEDLGEGHLLADDRIFDAAKNAFVFKYIAVGGRHLYGAPAPGRHWYLARSVEDGVPYLCSAAIPTVEHLRLATKLAADPPLIRPGVQVGLQVNCGSATDKVQQSLAARLKNRRLDQGETVATLKVVATESPTGEEASFVHGQNPFANDPNAQKVQLQQYECYFDLVDAQGHVLYGSPKTQIIRNIGVAGVMLKQGQGVSEKLEEILQQRVLSWANSIYLPTYLSASGQITQRPEALLGVNKP
jgi:WD40 repeat protein